MPLFEYKCEVTEEIFELLLPISEYKNEVITCSIHNNQHKAEKIWSIPGNIQIGEPTRYAVDKQGRIHLLHHKYDMPDADCEIKELKGPMERSRFEGEQMSLQKAASRTEAYMRESRDNEEIKLRHDDIKSKLNSYDNETQGLMKAAMERTKKMAAKPRVIKEPKMYIAANHFDGA